MFHQLYLLYKKAHEYPEKLHIEIEKITEKIVGDDSWFSYVLHRNCPLLFKNEIIGFKNDSADFGFNLKMLKLESKVQDLSFLETWLKLPNEICHIKFLFLLQFWLHSSSVTVEEITTKILNIAFISKGFNDVLSLLLVVSHEIAFYLLEKLILLEHANILDKEGRFRFIDLFRACATHFKDELNPQIYESLVIKLKEFSDRLFERLTDEPQDFDHAVNRY